MSYDNVSDFNTKTFSKYTIMLLRRNMTLGHGKMMKILTCSYVLLKFYKLLTKDGRIQVVLRIKYQNCCVLTD